MCTQGNSALPCPAPSSNPFIFQTNSKVRGNLRSSPVMSPPTAMPVDLLRRLPHENPVLAGLDAAGIDLPEPVAAAGLCSAGIAATGFGADRYRVGAIDSPRPAGRIFSAAGADVDLLPRAATDPAGQVQHVRRSGCGVVGAEQRTAHAAAETVPVDAVSQRASALLPAARLQCRCAVFLVDSLQRVGCRSAQPAPGRERGDR